MPLSAGFGRRRQEPAAAQIAVVPDPEPTPAVVAPQPTLKTSLAKALLPTDSRNELVLRLAVELLPELKNQFTPEMVSLYDRADLADALTRKVEELIASAGLEDEAVVKGVVEALVPELVPAQELPAKPAARNSEDPVDIAAAQAAMRGRLVDPMNKVQPLLLERIDPAAASKLPREELLQQLTSIIPEILTEEKIRLNALEQRELASMMLDEMLGIGPLEPLMADPGVTDIMVNGSDQVYVEKGGKLVLSDVKFRDNAHVLNIATRIVSRIGRRVDESTPMCDARLEDGSRVNVIIPPLAIDGPSISIRKFSKKKITLDVMARQGNISPNMATVLKIAARSRLNIVVSGGTGSGKTTLLNALSQMIDMTERIVTIEDAAELQLQQPHVVRLETRPPNLEGEGAITMRDLLKNSLRMRPDRIILGEVRGSECFDMLQAMNTGHDGSLCTIHANGPREALQRLENLVMMAGMPLPSRAIKTLVGSAVDMIVQISRMRDGKRRITAITEVVGMEEEVITTQDLFTFKFQEVGADGKMVGEHKSTGLRPHFQTKAAYFGLDRPLLEAMG